MLPTMIQELFVCGIRPWQAFAGRRASAPPLGAALVRMLGWRSPLAALGLWLSLLQYQGIREGLLTGKLPLVGLDLEPGLLRELGGTLPAPPDGLAAVALVLLLAPVSVLSLWLHHAVWDHGALWLMGCRGLAFRRTAEAEADAVLVGTLGVAAGLLGDLPGLGWVLSPLLLGLTVWFWGMRGFALAAWHGIPAWKGVVATVVHAVAAVVILGLMVVMAWMLAMQLAAV